MALTDSNRLGCGREVDDLWARIGREPDGHEADCPYCQSARQDLSELASATTALTESDATDDLLVSRPGALAAVMTIVRTEVRRGRTLPLVTPSPTDRGELTISEQAVASIVRDACDGFADLEGRRCRVIVADEQIRSPSAPSAPSASPGPNALLIELSVTVAREVSVPQLARELRSAVGEVVRRRVGVPVSSMTIHVEDLHDV